ncbi:alkaline phosphatase family protein [Reyranella sp. MMS21-HV4-11]|uniref:Alkaline phosphatase family protein n=1 Tax=Reyranella humidisoli TaxID=2849149 RepID=A0ABS6IVG7_9HYPH|nr:alkaline phosphatase D family protein [Reyranella sp. MMS21-HV4-11]MBU8877188.1 alkaline phosphatase family protein [Reyranella sp. MMS21-HV4-11]
MFTRRTLSKLLATLSLAPAAALSQGRPPLSRIAFGSCANQSMAQPIWEAILAYRPDLFIFAGDNVYGDFNTPDGDNLKRAYDTARTIPGYARLRETVSHLAVWDDHDYGLNDGGLEFPHKARSKELFLDFWNAPADDVRRQREGIYDARVIGPQGMRVQVILLDVRWFRSPLRITDQRGAPGKERYLPDPDPGKTMLGAEQWAWLADELRKPAEVRLVVSSTQVLAEGHGWERWGNFPLEKQKLIDTIRASGAKGVVLLSGDRHIGALYRETPADLYPLYEATSSGLNMVYWAAKEAGPNRLAAIYAAANFGVVEIDWWERNLLLALRDDGGSVRRSVEIPFDALGIAL